MARYARFYPWIFALLWFIVRVIAGTLIYPGDHESGRTLGVLLNLLFILILIFLDLNYHYRRRFNQRSSFAQDIKSALRSCMKYILASVLLMWLYYAVVSDELEVRRNHDYGLIAEAIDTDKELEEIRKLNPRLSGLSREEIEESMREQARIFTSTTLIIPASLIILAVAAVFYSLLGVFVWRKVIRP